MATVVVDEPDFPSHDKTNTSYQTDRMLWNEMATVVDESDWLHEPQQKQHRLLKRIECFLGSKKFNWRGEHFKKAIPHSLLFYFCVYIFFLLNTNLQMT